MKISKSQKVNEYTLKTNDGQQVYNFGRSHTLEFDRSRLKSTTIDDPKSEFNIKRKERASKEVGKTCEWVFNRETEVMHVYF